jgi:tetratricopeptide (TPR) repeat protein
MKKILLAALAAVLPALLLAASDYLKYIDLADEAVRKQDWNRAEELLREAMRSEPSNPQNVMLLSNVGMFQFYRGEDSLALHTLSEARAIAPASTVILNNRAKILRHMGREQDAMKDYDKVIEMDSLNYDAYFNRGYLRLVHGDSVGAKSDLATLERLRPDDPNTLLVLAVMYSNQGRYDEAVSYYNKLIKKVEKAEYYTGRAMCRLAKGDLAEASDDIGRGLELDPEDGELYYCRAYLHLLQYREEDAKADAALALRYGVSQARIDELFAQ